jgi:hypothetical protein
MPRPTGFHEPTPPAGQISTADKIWWGAGRFWLAAWMVVSAYISVVFLPTLVCNALNIASKATIAKIVELGLPFVGLGFGVAVGMAGLSFISRRFISSAMHADFEQEYERSAEPPSSFWGRFEYRFYRAILPLNWALRRRQ